MQARFLHIELLIQLSLHHATLSLGMRDIGALQYAMRLFSKGRTRAFEKGSPFDEFPCASWDILTSLVLILNAF